MNKKRVLLLGATGSIGCRTQDVISDFPEQLQLVGASAHSDTGGLFRCIERFHLKSACISSKTTPLEANHTCQFYSGHDGLVKMVEESDADIVVIATVGFSGVPATLKAIELGKTVALANKEVLVSAGELVMSLARENKVSVLPIDSEHCAIFQCISGHTERSVERLILTASGGPFYNRNPLDMQNISVEEALAHPTWNMGKKISIDSATMMNKGFEVIEAMHLFNCPADNIDVLIHPQSIVHSMVQFVDGAVIAQLGITDMYLPIQYALLHPERFKNKFDPLNLSLIGTLNFFSPDLEKFPCLRLAYNAAKEAGLVPTAMNAANEVAVDRFLKGEIPYQRIPDIVEEGMNKTPAGSSLDINCILYANEKIRLWAKTV